MNNALSRSKSAFFHPSSSQTTSTPASRYNKPHPPLPNVQDTPASSPSTSFSTIPFTCPTPCALHDHSYHSRSSNPAAPASSSGTVRSARSIFFESRRNKKSKVALDDDETYCVLSEEGVEILARSPEEEEYDETMVSSKHDHSRSFSKSSKALKRTPSLSNLLKTPSRLSLRKMPSKMKIFTDTPSSAKSNSTMAETSFSHNAEVPPIPAMLPEYHPAANTPTSNKSSRSSKSFLRRAVFRDKVDKLASKPTVALHDVSEHPLPGTVASRVRAMEDTYRRSLIVESEHTINAVSSIEVMRSASVPLLCRPDEEPVSCKLPSAKFHRNKWLDRLNIGKSSTSKRKTRLEIPNIENSPGLVEKVEKELKHRTREEQTVHEPLIEVEQALAKPTLRVQIDAPTEQDETNRASSVYPSPAATPIYEAPPFFDRLSLAVSPQFVGANHNHTFTFGTRLSATSYFGSTEPSAAVGLGGNQALVASSPLSGDLHISHSPARNGAAVVDALNASFRARETLYGPDEGDITGRFSIFSYEEKEKVNNDRPKSDPIPLKNIAQATNELRNLLESFEDTFAYDVASINTSMAPGTKHSYFASPAPPSRTLSPRKAGDEIPDDLQDLIDGAVQLDEVLRVSAEGHSKIDRPIFGASSFEGHASTAQEAIQAMDAYGSNIPQIVETATATFEWVAAPTIQIENEGIRRASSDIERRDSFAYSTSSTRSSMDGFNDQPIYEDGAGPRPSFDSGRSSFDEPLDERSYQLSAKQQKYLSSCSGVSNRSSLRDYLAMERPGLGERMLQEVDEDVALDPISDPHLLNAQRASFASTLSSSGRTNRDSCLSSIGHFQTARTSNLPFRFSSASESDGTGSIAHSPTPANGIRRALNRHSLDCERGDQSRLSLDFSFDGHGSPTRRSNVGSHPSSPVSDLGRKANESTSSNLPSLSIMRKSAALVTATSNAFVKQSTQSSLFSLSSVNSSPCPRPPRRKLLMLTGNRLPRAPPAAPVFASPPQANNQLQAPHLAAKVRPSMSPQQGRVRRLKDSWEAKMSPKKDEQRTAASGPSPRYVRPLPGTFENKFTVPRPQLLSNLALREAIIPPDTPPPSSPSASELSFGSTSRSSHEYTRGNGVQGRLASFGRRRGRSHQRQSSQLSKHSVIAEPIQEEVTATITLETIKSESPCSDHIATSPLAEQEYSDYTNAYEVLDSYLEDLDDLPPGDPSPAPKAVSPLVIRKTRSQTSITSERSLHLGLDAFQAKSQQVIKSRKSASRPQVQPLVQKDEIKRDPVIIAGEVESHWEALEATSQLKWTRFCHEAILELQKSRTLFPDTDATLDIYSSPISSSNSSITSSIYASPLIQAFSTPGSACAPDLTSPDHQSAIVSFILDSRARYKSDYDDGSIDMPSTPELSPDRSDGLVLQANGTSEITVPSPMHMKRLSYRPNQAKRTSYQPKSLMLVQKHLSNSSTTLLTASKEAVQAVEEAKKVREPAPVRPVLQDRMNEPALPKSKKGYKPRAAAAAPSSPKQEKGALAAVRKAEPIVRPLTPGKRIRAIAKNRNVQVYADEVLKDSHSGETKQALNARQAVNSFLPGRKLSQRRNDAFTAARRKLEGVGSPGEQSDRSSGASSTEATEVYKTGLENFASMPSSKIVTKGTVLEAGGSIDAKDTGTSGVFGLKSRPRPPSRRIAAGLVRNMR
ncbi:hypothetical protein P389DRAFT_211905 [Cystobasidium minutum MCA 4210]|uniref:uncharacterized protein n=1 Tax=Cystobasidium minutum MCA 4210 TaxID=1397322 RepID=UPI0034CE936F|eukprot:jgi/Rhomi1/211905/estExt_Genemark1.C_5_t10481